MARTLNTSGLLWLKFSFLSLCPKQFEQGRRDTETHKHEKFWPLSGECEIVQLCSDFSLRANTAYLTGRVRWGSEEMKYAWFRIFFLCVLKGCCLIVLFQKKRKARAWNVND